MPVERKKDEEMLIRLRRAAVQIAAPFGLAFRSIRKTRRDARLYGSCDTEGHIRIRLRSRVTGEFLKYSGLVATLCHELAHLRHFDHGTEFDRLYRDLLHHARAGGLCGPVSPGPWPRLVADRVRRPSVAASARPRKRPAKRPDPRQLALFGPEELPRRGRSVRASHRAG